MNCADCGFALGSTEGYGPKKALHYWCVKASKARKDLGKKAPKFESCPNCGEQKAVGEQCVDCVEIAE